MNMDEAYAFKQEKYRQWTMDMETQHPDRSPHMAVFCIGALGSIHYKIKEEMGYFGIPAKKARKIAIRMSIAAMLETYKVWCSRCNEKWQQRLPRNLRL